jgi:3-isopropylmalate/(R)-2-methylmalate dehydratase large subunit
MAIAPLEVRRIEVQGKLRPGVFAKDVILAIIRKLGVNGGVGYAYEYAGPVIEAMSMEERMTVCNMSIEGGARCGYVNPDQTTVEYLRGRRYTPDDAGFAARAEGWLSMASDPGCAYDDVVEIDGDAIEPSITWGIHPGHNLGVSESIPTPSSVSDDERAGVEEALEYMDFAAGASIAGTPIDVAFIGSCTNGRISDLREAARIAKTGHVKQGVRALVVPGSREVQKEAETEGLHEIFRAAGFQWREPGCSMCLAMNADKLEPGERCASTSNRNFQGRQGRGGRTHLVSPAMAAAAALAGRLADVRELT